MKIKFESAKGGRGIDACASTMTERYGLQYALHKLEMQNPSLSSIRPTDVADILGGGDGYVPADKIGTDFETNQPIYQFRNYELITRPTIEKGE